MAKISDRPEQMLGVQVLAYRAGNLAAAATAVKTAADAMLAGDTTDQFANDATLVAAFEALRDSYTSLTIAGLGDSTDLFTVETV